MPGLNALHVACSRTHSAAATTMPGPYALLSSLISVLLLATALTSAAALPPLTSLVHLNPTNELFGDTGGKAVDPRFSVLFQTGNEDLSDTSVYMNVLKTLAEISRHDFNDASPGGRWSFDGYTDVEIVIDAEPTPNTDFEWRFAIWGLYLAVRRVHFTSFVNCRTMMMWNGDHGKEVVGYLYIQKSLPNTVATADASEYARSDTNSSITTDPSLPEVSTSTTSESTGFLSAGKPGLRIEVIGRRLSKWGVLFPIYSAIVALATFDQTIPLPGKGIIARDTESKTKLNIEHWSEPRVTPPYFMPSVAIAGLSKVPVYMYREKKFNEVRFVFTVDSTPVGYGYIRKEDILSSLTGLNETGSVTWT